MQHTIALEGHPHPKSFTYGYPVKDTFPIQRHLFVLEWQHKEEHAEQST